MITAAERRDLHTALYLALRPPVYPRGRTVEFLHRESLNYVQCTGADVEVELQYFKGEGFFESIAQDKHNPDLPPYWALTSAGLRECRARGLA